MAANGIINATRVTSFPVTPNPAPGTVYYGVDNTDGFFKVQDSTGLVTNYGSGASYSDADAVQAIQDAIIAASIKVEPAMEDRVYLRDVAGNDFNAGTVRGLQKTNVDKLFTLQSDFLGTVAGEFTSFSSGTGASQQNVNLFQDAINNAIGVTQMDTGTTATGRQGLGLVAATVLTPTLAKYTFEVRAALESISTPTETFTARHGLGDFYTVGGDGTNGLFFSYTDLINGGRWLAISRSGGTTIQSVDTGVSPDLDMHVYRVELDEDGQQSRFYIDGALVATINAPSLPALANRMGAGTMIQKTLGTSQRNMSLDWMKIEADRTAVR